MSSLSMSILTSQLQLHKPMGWELSPVCSPLKPSTPLSRARSSAFVNSPSGTDGFGMGHGPPSMGQVGGMVPLVKLLSTAYEDSVIALCASAVAGLAIDSRNAEAFKDAGGVPNIVWLLKERLCHDVTFAVLWATTALARYPGTADALRDAGGVGALLAFLDRFPVEQGDANSDAEELAVQAAAALAELAASNGNNQEAILDLGGLQNLERLLRTGLGRVGGVSLSAIAGLRTLKALVGRPLSRGAVRCAEALKPSHVELVLTLLEAGLSGAPEVAEEAAAVLEVLSAASPVLCNAVLKTQGALPALVSVIRAGADTPGAASAAYALGHLAQQLGEPARMALAEEDAVEALLRIAQPEGLMPSEMLNASKQPGPAALAAAFALHQIHGPKEGPPPSASPSRVERQHKSVAFSPQKVAGGSKPDVPESIPALVNLLSKQGTAGFAIVHAAGALADLALAEEEHRTKICEAGGVEPAVRIIRASTRGDGSALRDQPPPALHQALRLVAGLAHSRAHTSALQEAGVVPLVVDVLLGPWGHNIKNPVASSALQALRWLSDNKAAQDEIRDCSAVPYLVNLLSTAAAPEEATTAAVATLRFLALNSRNREVIRECGAIPPLVALLRNQASSAVTVQVAAALTNLSRKKRSNMIAIAEAGGIPYLVSLLWQGSGSEAAIFSLSALTNLAYTSANRDAIREAGGIPALVHVLESCCNAVTDSTTLLGQVVAVLGNLAGTSKNRDAIREAGALPLLVALIDLRNPSEILGLAVSALTLLALSHTNADAIRREGAIPSLVLFLGHKSPSEDLTFKAAEAVRVLSAAPANRTALRDAGALEALVALLGPPGAPLRVNLASSNADLLVEVILAVRNLVTSTRNQDTVRELGGVARLVEILRDPETSAREQLHGVSALVNLFAHNSTNREVVRVSGGIDAFVALLKASIASPDASKAELTAQAALALGFLARSDANREAIRTAGGIPLLVQLLQAGPGAEITLCAVDALRHVVATPANAKALLKAGGVSPLLKLLEAGPEHEVTHQSLWVLKVLARSMAASEAIRTLGGLPLLVGLLGAGSESEATIQAAGVLRDMADVDSDDGLLAIRDSGAITALVNLLWGGKDGLRGQALSAAMAAAALANLAQCPAVLESILRAGAVEALVRAVQHPTSESQVSVKACASLLNLSSSDACRSQIIEAGAIPVLVGVLSHGQETDVCEAGGSSTVTTWATAVIASLVRSEQGRKAVEHAGAVQLLVDLLSLGPKSEPARQAAAAVQELACSAAGRECLTRYSVVPALLDLHQGSQDDDELTDCCIQGLTNLSRYPAARNELRNAGAMELLARGSGAVRKDTSSPAGAEAPVGLSDGDLMHVPSGGWSWQQVGRRRDATLNRLSSPSPLVRQRSETPASLTRNIHHNSS